MTRVLHSLSQKSTGRTRWVTNVKLGRKCGELRFGPAGKPLDLKGDILKAPEFLKRLGLDAMEYEAVRGVNISREKAVKLGQLARENNVLLSLHAPYYINLSSAKKATVEQSVSRLVDSLVASEWMDSYAVVFHPGYYTGFTKEEALKKVIEGIDRAWEEARSRGVEKTWLAPETTGKSKQVGSLDEIIKICTSVERCRPTVDWAHLYARSRGEFPKTIDDVLRAIEAFEREIGRHAVSPLHTHFSKIEYGRGGERKHHTMSENFGPDFGIICKAYADTGINATIISESPVLERDSLVMLEECRKFCE
uniref:Deoxyribonuclease IV n=1 Tax=Fervidicoccus fontis TaxID=683846 RepID=A0A7J3ZJ83_9CREN